ncbi:MAG: hypothetical protein K5910_04550 [Bacteroidales bacterium]|nr:hypothetical protein [Bacteroidales bacterium]
MKKVPILVLFLACLLLAGCKGKSYKDITVTSARIISIVPEGLTDLSALIELGIHNPTVGFEVTELDGLARYLGQDAVTVTADQLIVAGKSDKLYRIPLKGHIAEGFNPFQLLKLVGNESALDDVTFTIRGRIALRGGIGKNIEFKDIPLGSLMSPKETENDEKE